MSFYNVSDKEKLYNTGYTVHVFFQQLGTYYKVMYERYSNFVGQPHFDAMVKWIDYQEIALVIREMINVIKNDVCTMNQC